MATSPVSPDPPGPAEQEFVAGGDGEDAVDLARHSPSALPLAGMAMGGLVTLITADWMTTTTAAYDRPSHSRRPPAVSCRGPPLAVLCVYFTSRWSPVAETAGVVDVPAKL
ncbi:hypothetical protein [Streptomyces sp. DH8]|uniref:hypothetical protein n=1 Tax=Streptomyces sp. DH8 TaxID=2857008 RepID=UPI001E3B377B|nr:hypothetical protein [Streptomyces sp. DH8]